MATRPIRPKIRKRKTYRSEQQRRSMKRRYQLLTRILIPTPLFIGVLGYLDAGFNLSDSLYGSFCYYFVSVYYGNADNWLMEIARWTAPIVTFTGILYSLRRLFRAARSMLCSVYKDATVIYYSHDRESAEMLSDTVSHSFCVEFSANREGSFYDDVPSQVFMMDTDRENLRLYYEHFDVLQKRKVYMRTFNMDSSFLKVSNIHYFNLTHNMAALYWKQYPLLHSVDKDTREIHVAIIGGREEMLKEKLLWNGLLVNIFYEDQQIVYHMYGGMPIFQNMHKDFRTMNGDRIIYEENHWYQEFDRLATMDRIVISDLEDTHTVEAFLYTCPDVDVHYYSEDEEDPSRYLVSDHVHSFGSRETMINKDNIMGGRLQHTAMELYMSYKDPEADFRMRRANAIYVAHMRYSESKGLVAEETRNEVALKCWLELSGFMQSSYRSLADYYEGLVPLYEEGYQLPVDIEGICRLEHIRWCRLYFLNLWSYGVPESGNRRLTREKIHRALVPYDQLTEEDKGIVNRRIQFLLDKHEKDLKEFAEERKTSNEKEN